MISKTSLFVVSLLVASPALADEFSSAMTQFVQEHVMAWANDPAIVSQISAQNDAYAGLGQGQIDALDQEWRSAIGTSNAPLISAVLDNPAAAFLVGKTEEAGGLISEIFVTDNLGLNVAASAPTSDYWQGDEAKFTEVFGKGPDAMLIGEVEFDDSVGAYIGQVSIPVLDETGGVIGTMTIGLDAEALF